MYEWRLVEVKVPEKQKCTDCNNDLQRLLYHTSNQIIFYCSKCNKNFNLILVRK